MYLGRNNANARTETDLCRACPAICCGRAGGLGGAAAADTMHHQKALVALAGVVAHLVVVPVCVEHDDAVGQDVGRIIIGKQVRGNLEVRATKAWAGQQSAGDGASGVRHERSVILRGQIKAKRGRQGTLIQPCGGQQVKVRVLIMQHRCREHVGKCTGHMGVL